MPWRKLGRIFDPDTVQSHPKLATHAANPLPVQVDGDLYRVFFSGRDAHSQSSVGAVDIDLGRRRIERVFKQPVFEHGCPGSFYANGVSIGNVYSIGQTRYMLFMGWQAPADGHWRGDIGRLVLDDGLNLKLDSQSPFMRADETDPISLSYPWVMRTADGGFRMWYGSTQSWDAGNAEMLHVIREARSRDGHVWQRSGQSLPYVMGIAQAFSRPTVVESRTGGLDMWFSYRGGPPRTYRIGGAHCANGSDWELCLSDMMLDISPSGWDSEMVEYPFVLDHAGERLMFYNGNGYGRTGFGLAVLED